MGAIAFARISIAGMARSYKGTPPAGATRPRNNAAPATAAPPALRQPRL